MAGGAYIARFAMCAIKANRRLDSSWLVVGKHRRLALSEKDKTGEIVEHWGPRRIGHPSWALP